MAQETRQAPARVHMYPTRHGLDEDTRKSLVTLLNQRLADAVDLHTQTKHAHWNVKGMDFYQLHLLFDELAERVEHHADKLAERATALAGTALGTTRMAARATSLPEIPEDARTGREFIEALADSFGRHVRKVCDGIETAEEAGDMLTADLLTRIGSELDEALYFLESHLQAPSASGG